MSIQLENNVVTHLYILPPTRIAAICSWALRVRDSVKHIGFTFYEKLIYGPGQAGRNWAGTSLLAK